MRYPARLLSEGEHVVSEFRPHWSRIFGEGLLTLGVLVLFVILLFQDFPAKEWVLLGIAVVWLALIANGVIKWLTTQHVITNERVIFRAGLISKTGKEIPLEVVNDVAFNQTFLERILGSGDLLIESAGTHGQSRYRDIPDPEAVQTLIYKVREERLTQMRGPVVAPASRTPVQDLEILARLHDEGKLTDAEFEEQKRKLLGS